MLVAAVKEPEEEDLVWLLRYRTRRRILLAIGDAGRISATALRDKLRISTGSLYYNLRQLRRFVAQDKDKNYVLTEDGLRVYKALKEKGTITAADLANAERESRLASIANSIFLPLWLYTPLYEQKVITLILPALSALVSIALLIHTRQIPLLMHFYKAQPSVFQIVGNYLANIVMLYALTTVLPIVFSGVLFRRGRESLLKRIRSIVWQSGLEEAKFLLSLMVAVLPLMIYPAVLSANKLFGLGLIPAEKTPQYYLVTGSFLTISQIAALPLFSALIAYGRRMSGSTAALIALVIFFISHTINQILMVGGFT